MRVLVILMLFAATVAADDFYVNEINGGIAGELISYTMINPATCEFQVQAGDVVFICRTRSHRVMQTIHNAGPEATIILLRGYWAMREHPAESVGMVLMPIVDKVRVVANSH